MHFKKYEESISGLQARLQAPDGYLPWVPHTTPTRLTPAPRTGTPTSYRRNTLPLFVPTGTVTCISLTCTCTQSIVNVRKDQPNLTTMTSLPSPNLAKSSCTRRASRSIAGPTANSTPMWTLFTKSLGSTCLLRLGNCRVRPTVLIHLELPLLRNTSGPL